MRAQAALQKLLKEYQFNSVLDFGCGKDTPHKEQFVLAGKFWEGYDPPAGYYREAELGVLRQVDCIWASHVLEHIRNPIEQIGIWHTCLNYGGVLAVTVPPLKHEIVGGHINLYNAGLLLYHLVLAGFDCRDAAVKTDGYDISVLVIKQFDKILHKDLRHDEGDIESLAQYFPHDLKIIQGFDGRIAELNWR